jgi:hypothetical protein
MHPCIRASVHSCFVAAGCELVEINVSSNYNRLGIGWTKFSMSDANNLLKKEASAGVQHIKQVPFFF